MIRNGFPRKTPSGMVPHPGFPTAGMLPRRAAELQISHGMFIRCTGLSGPGLPQRPGSLPAPRSPAGGRPSFSGRRTRRCGVGSPENRKDRRHVHGINRCTCWRLLPQQSVFTGGCLLFRFRFRPVHRKHSCPERPVKLTIYIIHLKLCHFNKKKCNMCRGYNSSFPPQ